VAGAVQKEQNDEQDDDDLIGLDLSDGVKAVLEVEIEEAGDFRDERRVDHCDREREVVHEAHLRRGHADQEQRPDDDQRVLGAEFATEERPNREECQPGEHRVERAPNSVKTRSKKFSGGWASAMVRSVAVPPNGSIRRVAFPMIESNRLGTASHITTNVAAMSPPIATG